MTAQDSAKTAQDIPMLLTKASLHQEVDDQLRDLAHTLGVSVADVIRYFVSAGLKDLKEEVGGLPFYDPAASEQLDRLRAELHETSS